MQISYAHNALQKPKRVANTSSMHFRYSKIEIKLASYCGGCNGDEGQGYILVQKFLKYKVDGS